jgi:hypothetical protein
MLSKQSENNLHVMRNVVRVEISNNNDGGGGV